MDLKSYLTSKKIIGLSPMDGITDEPFRLLTTRTAKPDLTFTEFVSAEGISRGGVKLYDQLMYSNEERPIVGQLFGKDPESFYKAAVILCHLGFDGIDINMGCPARTVTQHGSGAALIGKPELASEIIKSVQKAVSDYSQNKVSIGDLALNQKTLEVINRNLKYSNYTPTVYQPTVSVKTRLGISEDITSSWIPLLVSHNLDFITLHGRTLKQGYAGTADWNAISSASKYAHDSGILFFGNGDLQSKSQALEYIDKYQLDGVLIGRAALGNPWVYSDHCPTFLEKFNAALLHSQLFQEIFPHRRFDPMRRNLLAYVSGHPNAKNLRSRLVSANSFSDLLALEAEIVD